MARTLAPMTPEEAQQWADMADDVPGYHDQPASRAYRTIANMTVEWAVRYEEKKTTKYQRPSKRAGYPETGDKWVPCDPYWVVRQTSWVDQVEVERLIGIYGADKPPRYRNARIVHRYVTEVIDNE